MAACCKCTSVRAVTWAAAVGLAFVVLGAILYACVPLAVRSLLASRKELTPGNAAFDMWLDLPVPVYRKFYLFNVTNHEEFLSLGAKPRLRQLGPYTFRQYEKKDDVAVDDEADTVAYRNKKSFVYVPEASSGSLEEEVFVPNVPVASVVEKVNDTDYLLISILLNSTGAKAIVNVTVGQFLFDGYKDSFIDLVQTFRGETILPDAKFGLMYGKNGSDDGLFKMSRGRKDPSSYGRILTWENKTSLNYWDGDACNVINGTDGRIFPSITDRVGKVHIFSPDICRSVPLDLVGARSFGGLETLRYELTRDALADGHTNRDNACFCFPPGSCQPGGVLNMAACRDGAPLYMSAPHFMYGSYQYAEAVEGTLPDPERHVSFIEIEPVSGMVLRAARRLQFNVRLRNNPEIGLYENVTDVLLPFAWIDENAEADDALLSMLTGARRTLTVAGLLPIVSFAVGASTVILASLVAFVLLHRLSSSVAGQNGGSKRTGNKYSLSQ